MSDAILKGGELFQDEEDDIQFEELHKLYTTNPHILKEFAYTINDVIFQSQDNKDRPFKQFNKKQFQQ